MMTKRTRLLREQRGWKLKDMADVLQIPMTTYRNYEFRSVLPVALIIPFCKIVDIDVETFLS
ncbi:MAG: hypothetical protein ACON4P_04695, partial [Candidatus Puniceispirillales bacterium]